MKLKAVAVNQELEIVHEASVQFEADLPEFRYEANFSTSSYHLKSLWFKHNHTFVCLSSEHREE